MKSVFRSCFCVVFVLLPALAQEAVKHDPEPTIRQTVLEVLLDVVVRDAHGRFVKSLKQSDLEVYEDGVRQEIRNFKLVSGRDVLIAQEASQAKPALKSSNPLKAVNLICIVFANVDFTDPNARKYAVDAVKEFLKNPLEPDTWLAVFNLDSQLTVLQPFTADPKEILAAANRSFTGLTVDFASAVALVLNATPNVETIEVTMNGNPATGGTVTATQTITGGEVNTRANLGANVSTSASANRQRGELAQQHRQFGAIEGMRQTDQLLAMIRQLATLPGRKSVLLFTPGLATTGDAELFKSVLDKANRANVAVYGIDTNGLSADLDPAQASSTALSHVAGVSSTQSAAGGNAAQNMERMRQGDYVNDAVRTTDPQASLRALSEGTGGFLIGSTNDLRKPFERLLEDIDNHYEVIYKPASSKLDGRLRSIEVKTKRPGLSADSQKGYFAMPVLGSASELAPFEMAGLAALNMRQAPHAFEFIAAAYQFRPAAASSQGDIVFAIPARNLQATPEAGGKRSRMHVAVLALVKDSNGQVVEKISQDSPYEIPDENLSKARGTNITLSHPISLPPGHYTIDTAVLDREANRASIRRFEYESPSRKGIGLSSILLVQGVEQVGGQVDPVNPLEFQANGQGKRVIPDLVMEHAANVNPYAYFVVYPDPSVADKPQLQAEFWVGDRLLAKQLTELPPPDATGAIPMIISTAAKPGRCELRVTVLQGGSSAQQSLSYAIASEAPR